MWPIVTTSDVEALWRPLTDDEKTVATARITLVEAELRRRLRLAGVPGTPNVGDPGYETAAQVTEWETLYTGTVAQIVKGSLLNPDGWLEETVQVDDGAVTKRRDQTVSSGVAFLSDDDVEKLLPPVRQPRSAFSIRLG